MTKILDRYLLGQFLQTFLFGVAALIAVFVVVDLVENLDDFLDNKASSGVIVEYYANYIPWMLKLLAPIGMLVGALFSVGRLSNQSEIIAMRSSGVGLWRLMLPIFLFSVVFSMFQLYFNGWIVPKTVERKASIERKYLNRGSGGGSLYNLFFRDSPLRNVIIQYYDAGRKSGNQVEIEEYSSEASPRASRRIEAATMTWDSTSGDWILHNAIVRSYSPAGISTLMNKSLPINLSIAHRDILQLQRSPEEMNFDELREYIETLKKGGKNVRRQLIDYYGQYSFPFSNVIVAIFGVSFASVRRRGGLAVQIATAMTVSFAYLIFLKIGQAIGYSLDIDEAIVGWLPNILFLTAAAITLMKTRT